MSWLFSRALVEASSVGICSDGDASAQSNGMPTPQAYSFNDKTMAYSRLSRFGMTCKPLTEHAGEELLTSYLGGFHVKTSQHKASAQGSMALGLECGATWRGSLASVDLDTRSLRTAQNSLLQDLTESYVTLPRWGSMRNGAIYQRPPLVRHTCAIESGLLPTPRVSRGFTNPTKGKPRKDCLTTRILGQPILGMRPNPRFVEWMMGFPIGWTALRDSETPKFQEWQQQHGTC